MTLRNLKKHKHLMCPTENIEIYQDGVPWLYELENKETGEKYVGVGDGVNSTPYNYICTTTSQKLKSDISKGLIIRRILEINPSYTEIKNRENKILDEVDAGNNPMYYNDFNGIPQEVSTKRFNLMKKYANEILENEMIEGVKVIEYDLTGIKTKKGGLIKSHWLNDVRPLQVREVLIDWVDVSKKAKIIDHFAGNFDNFYEETGLKPIVVILTDREYHGSIVDLRIGGNHTWHATLKAEYGFKLRILSIPKSIHGDWSDLEIRALGDFLNPKSMRDSFIKSPDPDDTIKTGLEIYKENKDEIGLTEYLNNHGYTGKDKTNIKKRVKTEYSKWLISKETPKNFIIYHNWRDKRIQKRKKELEKKYKLVQIISSGKLSLGDPIQKLGMQADENGFSYKNIMILVYHPSPAAKKEYDAKWVKAFDFWNNRLDRKKLQLKVEEMPWKIDEKKIA
tara:strand:- start:82 stop:1434 length:1353 start_codon:yes stop_codon:yes gene_type:complete